VGEADGPARARGEVPGALRGGAGPIDRITDDLLKHEHALLKDIESLDQLYEKTLAFYDELALYIAAGEAKLQELDTQAIPEKERAATAVAPRARARA
jgi:uncharacterized protein YaaN involved in tellurite resistance